MIDNKPDIQKKNHWSEYGGESGAFVKSDIKTELVLRETWRSGEFNLYWYTLSYSWLDSCSCTTTAGDIVY